MLRFQPDSWIEGLLRPLLMADPSAGLYYEEGAPDWRFAALIALLLLALVTGRLRRLAQPEQARALVLLVTMLYTWTFAIGNGRYFIAGLLMVGPLVVMAWRWLPGTRAFRWTLLAGLLAIQAHTVASMYRPGAWTLVGWRQGPAVYVAPHPIRDKPAVFVTVTAISFSALVPHFHPQSRWSNLGGQVDMTPDRPEYRRARELLQSPLPKYLVVPANQGKGEPEPEPDATMRRLMNRAIAEHGLALTDTACQSVRSNLMPHVQAEPGYTLPLGAFWICPIQERPAQQTTSEQPPRAMDDVFDKVEAYCPRFFSPGSSSTKRYKDHWMRYYLSSDSRVYIEDNGLVTYKYFRSFTQTVAGTVDEIRQGKLSFDCSRLPGRYRPPWASP